MRIRMTNARRRIANACRRAMSAARDLVHAYPEQLPVLIDIFSMGDLSQPRR